MPLQIRGSEDRGFELMLSYIICVQLVMKSCLRRVFPYFSLKDGSNQLLAYVVAVSIGKPAIPRRERVALLITD
ncbi:hypothetical protein DPMN_110984 [Dreissena polymorpha]|uniref:Uncharacterized protein n=1 Tax=Dreissena polymorpha TaxID=45954 RepID=A0A9D4KDL4_DREPO|nr:hypothetical protein DPMN_110984 [Dreissena polymorpha]